MFTERYALSPYIKKIRLEFKGLFPIPHNTHYTTSGRQRTKAVGCSDRHYIHFIEGTEKHHYTPARPSGNGRLRAR